MKQLQAGWATGMEGLLCFHRNLFEALGTPSVCVRLLLKLEFCRGLRA